MLVCAVIVYGVRGSMLMLVCAVIVYGVRVFFGTFLNF